MRVDQLIPAYHQGDAIGDTASHIKSFFLSQGYQSEIFCLTRDRGLENKCQLFEAFPEPVESDVTILHFALPSPLTPAFSRLQSKRVIIYHNITPESFFSDYSQEMAHLTCLGRKELKELVPHVDLALADSEYNRHELHEMGFPKNEVFPLFVDFSRYERPHSTFMYDLFDDQRVNILFVGRIVPNKRIDELIKVAFYFKKYISPLVRLIVVGKTSSLPKYYHTLIRLADEFYLEPEEICFTGHIPDEEMYALYKVSDVFLSLSEHEGFGLPFVESLIFDLPVIAFNCTAVPHTLGDAGILIGRKDVDFVSELVHLVTADEELRNKVIQGQRQQLEKYKGRDLENYLGKIIETLTGKDD
jgi:glycosyltransferase involved in cell wall biosynthesis